MAYHSNAETVSEFVEANYVELVNPGSFDFSPFPTQHETFESYYGQPAKQRLFINAYEMGQAYGGPEEGGWWVTTYEPLASIPVSTLDEAKDAIAKLDTMLREQYEHEREYYSAAGGADATIMAESHFAKFHPDNPDAYRYS